jgi:choline kinase
MKALILAAGRGSRMGELTAEQPKCMVEFQGRSLLNWQQEACVEAGIRRVGVVAGYRREVFDDTDLMVFENPKWETTNMVRSLQCAGAWLSAGPCIVSYSDIFYEAEAVRLLMQSKATLGVLYEVNWREQWEERFENPLSDAETFRIDAAGHILEIGNRAKTMDEIQGQYMGLLRFTPESWRQVTAHLATMLPEAINNLSMTALLNQMIAAGVTVTGIPYEGVWGEIDSESDLIAHENRFSVAQLKQRKA